MHMIQLLSTLLFVVSGIASASATWVLPPDLPDIDAPWALPPELPDTDAPASAPAPSPSEDIFPPPPPPSTNNSTLEYMDPTLPPLLPTKNPKCSLLLLRRDFAHTLGAPPASAPFSTPLDCPAPWSRVILELSASASDVQRDRIAAVWLGGAEILRTTTPRPMSPGAFWRIQKDITKYTALLRGHSPRQVSVMLENSNDELPGVYSINITLHFYRGPIGGHPLRDLYSKPADAIIPISRPAADAAANGFWFRLTNQSLVQASKILVPRNAYRAVLEVFVSHHGDDEYWYANPLRTTSINGKDVISSKSNGGFRQLEALIDGRYVGSAIPFPVIYPGSVNPYFWTPVAAIGAYDHPSYDLELTPFIGQLTDGKPHEFGLTVRDCQPYWLVDANLHLWLDDWSDVVEGGLVRYKVPLFQMSKQAEWRNKDGKSEVGGQTTVRFSGWVSSSEGNISTSIRHKIKFRSQIEVENKGSIKKVEMEAKERTTVRIEKDDLVVGRISVDTENPLALLTQISNGGGRTKIEKTKLVHEMMEMRTRMEGRGAAERWSTITDRQEAVGSMLLEEGGEIVWGSGDTKSMYKYRDDKECYLRTVEMVGGKVEGDGQTASCSAMDISTATS